jgi:hypothetical protein
VDRARMAGGEWMDKEGKEKKQSTVTHTHTLTHHAYTHTHTPHAHAHTHTLEKGVERWQRTTQALT